MSLGSGSIPADLCRRRSLPLDRSREFIRESAIARSMASSEAFSNEVLIAPEKKQPLLVLVTKDLEMHVKTR